MASNGKGEEWSVERFTRQVIKKTGKGYSNRSLRACLGNKDLHPAIKETPTCAVSLAHKDILATRARHHRRQLRVSQRASETQDARRNPDDDDHARRPDIAFHYTRIKKDARADDVPNDDGSRSDKRQSANECDSAGRRFGHKFRLKTVRGRACPCPFFPSIKSRAGTSPAPTLL